MSDLIKLHIRHGDEVLVNADQIKAIHFREGNHEYT